MLRRKPFRQRDARDERSVIAIPALVRYLRGHVNHLDAPDFAGFGAICERAALLRVEWSDDLGEDPSRWAGSSHGEPARERISDLRAWRRATHARRCPRGTDVTVAGHRYRASAIAHLCRLHDRRRGGVLQAAADRSTRWARRARSAVGA